MSESIEGITPELQEKLGKALDIVLGGNEKELPKTRRLTKAEYDLRVEYVRLSWRLLGEIGPFNFEAQARDLLTVMSLVKLRGGSENDLLARITDTIESAGLAPKETV